jgi:hypothetical protein
VNVFEFARIVELNRAILRESASRDVSHPCSNMGTHTRTGWFGVDAPPQPSTQKPGKEAPMSCPDHITVVNPGSASDGAL